MVHRKLHWFPMPLWRYLLMFLKAEKSPSFRALAHSCLCLEYTSLFLMVCSFVLLDLDLNITFSWSLFIANLFKTVKDTHRHPTCIHALLVFAAMLPVPKRCPAQRRCSRGILLLLMNNTSTRVSAQLLQSRPTLWDPMDCSLPGSSP